MRILESERLLLKPIEEKDLDFLMNLRWDKEMVEYIIHNPIGSINQKRWFEQVYQKGDLALSIFYKTESGEYPIIGTIGLYDFNFRHQRAVLKSTRILKEYQKKGLGTEATDMVLNYGFNTLNLNKISCDIFEDNHARLKGLITLGFQKEGVLLKHYFHQGVWKDAAIYGLLRDNYNQLKSND